MAKFTIEIPDDELVVMDGWCNATGISKTTLFTDYAREWTSKKIHESIVVCRMARINALEPQSHSNATAKVTLPSGKWEVK